MPDRRNPSWPGRAAATATVTVPLRELAGFVAGLLVALLSAPFVSY